MGWACAYFTGHNDSDTDQGSTEGREETVMVQELAACLDCVGAHCLLPRHGPHEGILESGRGDVLR